MKKISILILFVSFLSCGNSDEENKKNEQRQFFTNPVWLMFWYANSKKAGSPLCGGDPIGTLIGENNFVNSIVELKENEDLIIDNSKRIFRSYFSNKKSQISLSIIGSRSEGSQDTECFLDNTYSYLQWYYCDGINLVTMRRDSFDQYIFDYTFGFNMGVVTTIEPLQGKRNFLEIGNREYKCLLKIRIKSEVSL
jgi:hypothetical protein